MNYYLFFCVLSIGFVQFCSNSDQQAGLLQEAEYKLWGIQHKNSSIFTGQNNQFFEFQSEPDTLNCQTKAVSCCLVCLASTPCFLYIASCFLD